MNELIKNIIYNNDIYLKKIKDSDPDYFIKLNNIKYPSILWIGCSDNRINENVIIPHKKNQMLVYRTIANIINMCDNSILSLLDYSINILDIENIVICGHYDCKGIKKAIEHDNNNSFLNDWLIDIKKIYNENYDTINKCYNQKINILSELNVIQQSINIGNTSIIQNAWRNKKNITINSIIYNPLNGKIKQIIPGINNIKILNKIINLDYFMSKR